MPSPSRFLIVLLSVAVLAPGVGAKHASEGLPFDAEDARAHAERLDRLGEAPGNATRVDAVLSAWDKARPLVRQIAPDAADLLVAYHVGIEEEGATGNASNVRDFARAAAHTMRRDVVPALEEWGAHPTHVLAADPRSVQGSPDTLRVPLVLVHPPVGGVGAFDVTVTVTGAEVVAARVETGEGNSTMDRENGSARLAAFDARALAGLGGSAQSVVLGSVDVRFPPGAEAGSGLLVVDAFVTELANGEGERVPALGFTRTVDAHAALDRVNEDSLRGLFVVAAGLVAIVLALFVMRKLVKV